MPLSSEWQSFQPKEKSCGGLVLTNGGYSIPHLSSLSRCQGHTCDPYLDKKISNSVLWLAEGWFLKKCLLFLMEWDRQADGAAEFTLPSFSLDCEDVTSTGLPRTTEKTGTPTSAAQAWVKRVRKTHLNLPKPLNLFLFGLLLFLISKLARVPFLGAAPISQAPGLELCFSFQMPEDNSRQR